MWFLAFLFVGTITIERGPDNSFIITVPPDTRITKIEIKETKRPKHSKRSKQSKRSEQPKKSEYDQPLYIPTRSFLDEPYRQRTLEEIERDRKEYYDNLEWGDFLFGAS